MTFPIAQMLMPLDRISDLLLNYGVFFSDQELTDTKTVSMVFAITHFLITFDSQLSVNRLYYNY